MRTDLRNKRFIIGVIYVYGYVKIYRERHIL